MRELPAYIKILRSELEIRQKKNPRFSLRGFAAMLDIHPSALSRILSGKQEMSLAICRQVLKVLSLNGVQHAEFVHSYADSKRQQVLAAFDIAVVTSPTAPPALAAPLSLETYENLVEVAPSPAWFASVDGTTFFGNRLLKEFTASAETAQGSNLSFIHSDDLRLFEEALDRTRSAPTASECNVRLVSGTGECLPFKVRIAPIRDYARNLTFWLVTASQVLPEARTEAHAPR